jgi:multisubunit Na+/H+ antiporter MnhB subunit
LHQLWLEVTGIIFLVMALSFAGASVKEYAKYRAGQVSGSRLAIAVCCTAVFAWFGVSSFWKVRRKSPRP